MKVIGDFLGWIIVLLILLLPVLFILGPLLYALVAKLMGWDKKPPVDSPSPDSKVA